MLVSSVGYFKNSLESFKRIENYNKTQIKPVATKGLPKGYKAEGNWEIADVIQDVKSLFDSQTKLGSRAIDMIG